MTLTPPDADKTARRESDVPFTPRPAPNEPQFAPGTVIAGRYRIASILHDRAIDLRVAIEHVDHG